MSQHLRAFKKRPKAGDPADEVIRISVTGGIDVTCYEALGISYPPPPLKFVNQYGRKCVVRGGLPDILPGEADPRDRVLYTSRDSVPQMDSVALEHLRAAHSAAMSREHEGELEAAASLRHAQGLAPAPRAINCAATK